MAKNNDPLIESLMQLAVSAAPLIRKAREAGIFRDRETMVDAEIVTPSAKPEAPTPPKAPEPPPAAADSGHTAALQDIVVRQALRINELETEVAALKAALLALQAAKA